MPSYAEHKILFRQTSVMFEEYLDRFIFHVSNRIDTTWQTDMNECLIGFIGYTLLVTCGTQNQTYIINYSDKSNMLS